jgi:predicted transcriptional regulator
MARLAGRTGGRRKGMIAVLISIRPEWCEKIISGEKTIEVRKTRPKMDTPFKCYIYCTKPEEKLITIMKDGDENYGETYHGKPVFIKTEKAPTTGLWDKRQKVIGEFVCDDIFERIVRVGTSCEPPKYCICDWNMDCTPLDTLLADACLTKDELEKYLDGGVGYGWHISNLRIYDTPRELREFYAVPNEVEVALKAKPKPVTRPPQSWRYVEELP